MPRAGIAALALAFAAVATVAPSASADAAFSPTEPRPPAVNVRLAQSRATVSFGSEVQTGFLS